MFSLSSNNFFLQIRLSRCHSVLHSDHPSAMTSVNISAIIAMMDPFFKRIILNPSRSSWIKTGSIRACGIIGSKNSSVNYAILAIKNSGTSDGKRTTDFVKYLMAIGLCFLQ